MITKSRKGQKYFRQLESKVWVLKSDYKTERVRSLLGPTFFPLKCSSRQARSARF